MCAYDLSSGELWVERHVWSGAFPHGRWLSVVCTHTNLVCVFKEKLCLSVELSHIHFHDLCGAGGPSVPSRRCIWGVWLTTTPLATGLLLSTTHTERGKPRLPPELTSILLHRCNKIHSFIANYGFVFEKCLLVVICPKVVKPWIKI